jgi:signal transduction histidine kinase
MPGLALYCDPRGSIVTVLKDDLGLTLNLNSGETLYDLLPPSSAAFVTGFLDELHRRHAVFDLVTEAELAGSKVTLHFAGNVREEGLGVIVSDARAELPSLFRELQQEAEGFQAGDGKEGPAWERLYDDLTRLNNEMVNLQRQMAKQNVELEKLNGMKNQFLGMAAHDLRNPLGVVMAYAKFLLAEASGKLTPEQMEFVSIIHTSSEYMLRLVDNFLDVAKIESGSLELEKEPVDLVALLERNVRLNRVLAERKRVSLEFAARGEIPEMRLDGPKIEQVMNNLITNAVKFSLPDSSVRVEVWQEGLAACVAVTDQGQGIPPGETERLFRPFEQASVQSTAGEKGVGLGLAIVRRIVEGHGGRIWLESEPGRGTSFFFTLPSEKSSG